MKSKKFIALVLGMSMAIGSSPAVVFAEELPESGTAVTEEDLPENGEASEEEASEVTLDEVTVDEIVSVESANSDRIIYYGELDQNGDVYWELYESGRLEISVMVIFMILTYPEIMFPDGWCIRTVLLLLLLLTVFRVSERIHFTVVRI